jgi:hypothetical protein
VANLTENLISKSKIDKNKNLFGKLPNLYIKMTEACAKNDGK